MLLNKRVVSLSELLEIPYDSQSTHAIQNHDLQKIAKNIQVSSTERTKIKDIEKVSLVSAQILNQRFILSNGHTFREEPPEIAGLIVDLDGIEPVKLIPHVFSDVHRTLNYKKFTILFKMTGEIIFLEDNKKMKLELQCSSYAVNQGPVMVNEHYLVYPVTKIRKIAFPTYVMIPTRVLEAFLIVARTSKGIRKLHTKEYTLEEVTDYTDAIFFNKRLYVLKNTGRVMSVLCDQFGGARVEDKTFCICKGYHMQNLVVIQDKFLVGIGTSRFDQNCTFLYNVYEGVNIISKSEIQWSKNKFNPENRRLVSSGVVALRDKSVIYTYACGGILLVTLVVGIDFCLIGASDIGKKFGRLGYDTVMVDICHELSGARFFFSDGTVSQVKIIL
jgi:hypothetical protein